MIVGWHFEIKAAGTGQQGEAVDLADDVTDLAELFVLGFGLGRGVGIGFDRHGHRLDGDMRRRSTRAQLTLDHRSRCRRRRLPQPSRDLRPCPLCRAPARMVRTGEG